MYKKLENSPVILHYFSLRKLLSMFEMPTGSPALTSMRLVCCLCAVGRNDVPPTLPSHHSRPSRLQWDRYRQIWFLTQLPMQSIQPAKQENETAMSLEVDVTSKWYGNAKWFIPWDRIQQAPCLCNPKRPSWQICWLARFRMSQTVRWKLIDLGVFSSTSRPKTPI